MGSEHASTTPTIDRLAILTLPSLNGLSEQQLRGVTCVWDGIALSPETAVNLGPRRKHRPGGHFDWYPRACRHCIYTAAYRDLHAHVPSCPRCPHEDPGCATAVGLLRLMRDYR